MYEPYTPGRIIAEAVVDLPLKRRKIVESFDSSETLKEAADSLGVTKQAVEINISRLLKEWMADGDFKATMDKAVKNVPGKVKYIDCRTSCVYSKVFGKILNMFYGYRIFKGVLATTDDFKGYPTKRFLLNIAEKRGLPLELSEPDSKTGSIDAATFFYNFFEDEWLLNKEGDTIIGNRRSSIVKNACLYQLNRPVSFWSIINDIVDGEDLEYIEDQYINDLPIFCQRNSKLAGWSNKTNNHCKLGSKFTIYRDGFSCPIHDYNTFSGEDHVSFLNSQVNKIEEKTKKLFKR